MMITADTKTGLPTAADPGGAEEGFDIDGQATEVNTESDSSQGHGDAGGEATETTDGADARPPGHRRARVARMLAYAILPAAALLLAVAAGYLKWVDGSARLSQEARAESVQAAIDSTVAMLSYRPDTVESNLAAARDRMTGAFRDSYSSLTRDVVIPGAKQRQISAVATVPAAASVSATATHAVVLVFVDQSTIIGSDPPTQSASSVKVTLEKVRDRWLISQFDPV
jgi:Mce-associated membrane protein